METQAFNLDQAKLKSITDASHTSVVAMLRLAIRVRDREFVNVTSMKEELIRMGEKVVDEDYFNFWRSLETLGLGKLIVGRRGNPDRFKCHYSLKNIAKSAIEGKEHEIKELQKKKSGAIKPMVTFKTVSEIKAESKAAPKKRGRPPVAKQTFINEKTMFQVSLSNGTTAEFILPKDISSSDLERVREALSR